MSEKLHNFCINSYLKNNVQYYCEHVLLPQFVYIVLMFTQADLSLEVGSGLYYEGW